MSGQPPIELHQLETGLIAALTLLTSPGANTYVLTSDGVVASWQPVPGTGTIYLSSLGDVALTTLTVNDILTWNGTKWTNLPGGGGSGSVTSVAATGSTGLVVGGSPITTSGTLTFTLGTELQALSSLSTTGFVQRTGVATYTVANLTSGQITTALGFTPGTGSVTSVAATGSTGLTVGGSPITASGTLTFTLGTELQGLSALAATGIVVRTGAGTYTPRVISSSTLNITNGNGVSGNPTIELNTTSVTSGTYTGATITVDSFGRISAASSVSYLTTNQSITLSGDVSGAGTTAITTTLATVNPNVGTWNNVTVNGKGLVTAGSNVAYLTTAVGSVAVSSTSSNLVVTTGGSGTAPTFTLNLSTDLQALGSLTSTGFVQRTGAATYSVANLTQTQVNTAIGYTPLQNNQIVSLSGDATGSSTGGGSNTVPVTLATVNSNVGTFGNGTNVSAFTVNGKGLITAASNTAITFPVTTVFGRSGAVVAASNDYSFTQISGTLGLTQGGTGQTTANAALNALLPSQTGNNSKVLQTDGTNTSWVTVSAGGGGTVTSVAATGSTGLTVGGSPITTSGTLTFTLGAELQGLNGLSTNGYVVRTGVGTYITQAIQSSDVTSALGYTPVNTLSGDITTPGSGSGVTTLATVNANVGTFGDGSNSTVVTVNGKGLITAVSVTPINFPASPVTSVFGRTGVVSAATNDYSFAQISGTINLTTATQITGTLGVTHGGTGLSSTGLTGSILYGSGSNVLSQLAGNTTTTKQYLSQTGNGTVSAAPAWAQVSFSDLSGTVTSAQMPAFTGDITTSAGSTATTLATVNGNVGSFTNANITVNAKGLITAASTGSSGGVTSVTGTANQITASPTTGAVVVSLPTTISIGTAATGPTINAVTGTTTGNSFAITGSGAGGANSAGGNLTITAGAAGGTSGNGGNLVLQGGSGQVIGGSFIINTGSTAYTQRLSIDGQNGSWIAQGASLTFSLAALGGGFSWTAGNKTSGPGTAGGFTWTAGSGTTTSVNAGNFSFVGGSSGVAGTGSSFTVALGTSTAAGGAIAMTAGTGTQFQNGGDFSITAGATVVPSGGTTNNGGNINITAGTVSFSGVVGTNTGGNVVIATGQGSTTGGAITFKTGATTTSTTVLTINNNGAIGTGSAPAFGTLGQVLTSAGTGGVPTWVSVPTSIVAGTNISVSGATGAVTVNVSGTVASATTATNATNLTTTDDTTTNISYPVTFQIASGGTNPLKTSATKLYFNPNTGTLNAVIFNSTSDLKLKKNIRNIDNATSIVENLNGVRFDWKETNKPSAGLIAQEVEVAIPELVHTDEFNVKSVNYNGIVGVLLEAMKEMNAKIEAMQTRIKELEG